MIIVRT